MFTLLLIGIAFGQLPKVGEGMCFLANQKTPTIAPQQEPIQAPVQPQPPQNIQSNLPSGFKGKNKGIGSFFSSSKSSDATNGRSWCGFPYKDYTNGFAPDLSVMTDGTNAVWTGGMNNYAESAKKYCGLEARVTNLDNGAVKVMYIVDAFDPRWVKSPGSIDIMTKSWEGLAGRPANDKNVVLNVEWELTGNRNPRYVFDGNGDP
jgi:hypothetical protein